MSENHWHTKIGAILDKRFMGLKQRNLWLQTRERMSNEDHIQDAADQSNPLEKFKQVIMQLHNY